MRPARAPARLDTLLPLLVFVAALAVRLWFVLEQHPPELYLKWDMANYDLRAERFAAGSLTPWDAFTPVGYPAVLALVYALTKHGYAAVAVLHAVLGAATAALVYPLARRLQGGRVPRPLARGLALVAAGAIAAHLPLLVYTGFLLTETTFAFLVAAFAYGMLHAHDRRSEAAAVVAGVVLALGCAVRPNLVFALPLLGIAAWLGPRRGGRVRFAVSRALLVATPLLLVVAARTTLAAGRPAFLGTNGGVNFFLAHTRYRGVTLDPNDPIVGVSGYHNRHHYTELFDTGGRHAYDERYFYRAGLLAILREPGAALRETASNLEDGLGLGPQGAWPDQGFWPGWMGHDAGMNAWGRASFFVGVLPCAAWGAWCLVAWAKDRRRRAADRAGGLAAHQLVGREDPAAGPRRVAFALVASVVVAMALFIGDPRVRVSFDPIFYALATEPLARGIAFVTRRRGVPRPRAAHLPA